MDRGSNFGDSPLILVIFRVNDPNNPVLTSGEITPTNGNIFEHWAIPTGTKAGEYKVEARDLTGKKIKSDNFQISAVLVTPEMPFGTLGTIIMLLVGLALFATRGLALNAPLRKIMPA